MKIGILTITDGANYGNRLQNYALQETLISLGYDVETISRRTFNDKNKIQCCRIVLKDIVKRIIGKKNTNFNYKKRKKRFDSFNRNHIFFSDTVLENNNAPTELKNKYDYFVCGSDQIWNARFAIVNSDIKNHLAAFADPEQRIAFAASFGTNDIAPGYEEIFTNELQRFKALGVREETGVDIIKKYTGRTDARVVLDPTFLQNKDSWIKIEQKPSYIGDKKYIITYFLGGRSPIIQEYIEALARKYHAAVINLEMEFLTDDKIKDRSVYTTTPDEFVWLIDHSECVLTDSFHASAFSIIFGKPFLVFERLATEKGNDMGSRIDTLLSKFGLMECKDDLDQPSKMPVKYNTKKIEEKLRIERRNSLNFLKKALED